MILESLVPAPTRTPKKPRTFSLLDLFFVSGVLVVALLGLWVASSLAADRGAPVWLSLVAALLVFPLLPLFWELRSSWVHRKATGRRFLRAPQRILLRTLLLNLLFVALLLGLAPASVFRALSRRGDWMLSPAPGPRGELLRSILFWSADRLEWLYLTARNNPYDHFADDRRFDPLPPDPVKEKRVQPFHEAKNADAGIGDAGSRDNVPPSLDAGTRATSTSAPSHTVLDEPPGTPLYVIHGDPALSEANETRALAWPLSAEPHPLLSAIRPEEETGPAAVARLISERETDPLLRLKAVHDYVALRLAYDTEGLRAKTLPPQDADSVFAAKKAVCAGYARLFQSMAEVVGAKVVTISGEARVFSGATDPESHAWNAVLLDSTWRLVDVTWDAGAVEPSGEFRREYKSDHFLTPPEIFGVTHFPNNSKWQLRTDSLTRGEFLRQPLLAPGFFAAGLVLHAPDRARVDVEGGNLELDLENPEGLFLRAVWQSEAEPQTKGDCQKSNSRRVILRCMLPNPGVHLVKLCVNRDEHGLFNCVAELSANNPG